MAFTAGCWRPRLAGLVLATIWLAACATGASEPPVAVCPPVVEYSPEFQARAAEELALLPKGSAISEMLNDYAVMRDQARPCTIMTWTKEIGNEPVGMETVSLGSPRLVLRRLMLRMQS